MQHRRRSDYRRPGRRRQTNGLALTVVQIALKGLVNGEGEASEDPVATIKERYTKGENDEFLKPIIVSGDEGRLKGELHPY